MKRIQWQDERGWKHVSLIPDNAPDTPSMQKAGIRQDPPDVSGIDWETVKRELHNGLIEAGLVTWQDVQRQGNSIAGIVMRVIRKPIIELYRAQDKTQEQI